MSEIDDKPFPRAPLLGAGVLIAMTIALAAGPRLGYLPPVATATSERVAHHVAVVETRSLRFTDRADGALVIDDVGRGTVAAVLPHGVNNGFIRGVLRGMARDRKLRDVGPQAPFTLTLFADDALTLSDPSTGRNIELGSFGPTNKQSFADLLLLHRPVASAAARLGKVDL
jgi:putative photosynthetic complex assembly protein